MPRTFDLDVLLIYLSVSIWTADSTAHVRSKVLASPSVLLDAIDRLVVEVSRGFRCLALLGLHDPVALIRHSAEVLPGSAGLSHDLLLAVNARLDGGLLGFRIPTDDPIGLVVQRADSRIRGRQALGSMCERKLGRTQHGLSWPVARQAFGGFLSFLGRSHLLEPKSACVALVVVDGQGSLRL